MGPTLASFTMSRNLWLPIWINIGLLLCAIPTILYLPDMRSSPILLATGNHEDREGIADEAGPLLAEHDQSPSRHANAFDTPPSIRQNMVLAVRKLIRLITGRRNFQVLLCSIFLTSLASSDTRLLVQYISKRYEWTFAQVNLLISC
jgi:hypothetical protein